VLEEFRTTVESIGIDFPIWIVTNLSVRNALPLEPAIFDLVIIDEASQCDIPSAFPLLFRARRALIIGDPQQLRHISTLSSQEEEKLAIQHGVGELLTTWSYNQRSLYALAEERILVGGNKPLFLAEHYRSHPKIIEFVNHCFYQGQLVIRTPLNHLADHLKSDNLGLFWHDVRGIVPLSSRSAYNEVELRAVLELLDKWAQSGFLLRDEVSFGVVTPFRLQMERLEEAIRARPWWNQVNGRLTVGTAHRFQGDERDIMIMSPVVSEGMHPRLVRWVSETGQLLNVAITRGRGALHIVGDVKACLSAGGFLAKLASPVRDGQLSRNRTPIFDSPDETRMAEFLAEVGLWFEAHHPVGKYQLDFLVISPFGTRYDLEVDGRGHWTDEATHHDEIRDAAIAALGMKIVRISARQIFNNKDGVCELLRRLV
jgi:very-short-patch-repair endonuclease